MEQFRQRVAAACHIGPLDQEETQRYIEHRLKRAGSTGKPSFDAETFAALYQASRGIPRRINSVCDRLLLLGFLTGKTHLAASDVAEVMKELEQETSAPARSVSAPVDGAASPSAAADIDLDIDPEKLELDPAAAKAMSKQLASLSAEQRLDQLQRLERSLLRLERINVQTLAMLQKLVGAVKKSSADERVG
jgi:hypothetical protein